jgi:phospholipid/cholesterol/gamma-HCH transport system substrate-binding protein
MKISNETKVGLLTIVALILLILGFNFLKGNNVLNKSKKLYAIFPDAGSLDKSNSVKIKGLPIGSVYNIDATDKNLDGISITINWSKNINIPRNSYASIVAPLVGSSYINIDLGDSKDYLKDGDTLRTKTNNGLLGDLSSQVNPTLSKARTAIDSLTIVLGSINKFFDPATKNNFQGIVANLMVASSSLTKLLDTENGMLASTLHNLDNVSANLAKNNDTITSILHHTNVAAENLASLKLGQTVDSVRATVAQLNDVIYRLGHNNGSLGLLLNDKKLYENLNNTALGMQILIDDIRVHPKRYVNISVFGKKDKGNYLTSPLKKDSL